MLRFDAIVIGAGVGGLCTAALLAREGYKVLVVDSLPFLGGRCSSIDYRGFKLSTGAFWIPVGEVMENTFREVGADYDVVAPTMSTIYRIEGEDFDLTEGRGAFRRMMDKVTKNEEETQRVLSSLKTGMISNEGKEDLYLDRWLRGITGNQQVHELFHTVSKAFIGNNLNESLVREFLSILLFQREAHRYGFTPEGNARLIESLTSAIRNMGGTLWTRARAERIGVKTGKAVAVDIVRKDNGSLRKLRVQAEIFISNVGPRKTVSLIGRDKLDKDYLRMIDENTKPLTQIDITVSSDIPLIEHKGILVPNGMKRLAFITSPTNVCPGLAPPGKHLLEVCVVTVPSVDAHLSTEEKAQEKKLAMDDLRTALTGFEEHAEILRVAWFGPDWPALRRAFGGGFRIPQETPVGNLFNVGDGTSIGEGWHGLPLSLCAESARIAVEKICAKGKS